MEISESSKITGSLNYKELLSNVVTTTSMIKYDYDIAKSHFIQQLGQIGMVIKCIHFLNLHYLVIQINLIDSKFYFLFENIFNLFDILNI